MESFPRLVAFTVISGLASSCVGRDAAPAAAPDTTAAAVLWLPAEATLERDAARPVMIKNGRSIYVNGTGAVVFTINGDREELSNRIVEHFAAAGWRQRPMQHLIPHLATSFEPGWDSRCACVISLDPQGKPIPHQPYHQWRGEWENERGDLVTYDLGGEGRQLRGYASYVPRLVVEEVLRKLGR